MLDSHHKRATLARMDDQIRVSASRVPAMLGMDHRCSPLTLYLRMRGQLSDDADNAAIQAGRYYERATADWACDAYGMKIQEAWNQAELSHGPLSGHPDFLVVDEHDKIAILEVKNPFWSYKGDDWGEPGTDEVPQPYFLQTLTYVHLLHKFTTASRWAPFELADYGYVCAKLAGGICRYKIPYDKAIISKIEAEAQTFIHRVVNEDPPTPQDEQDMRNLWPVTEGKVIDCNSALVEQLKTLADIKQQIKQLAEQESALKTFILGFAQDAERIEWVKDDGTRIPVCSLATNRQLDAEQLAADHPELLAKFAKLDTAAVRKHDKALVERYMRKPTDPTKASRVIRLKLPKEEQA